MKTFGLVISFAACRDQLQVALPRLPRCIANIVSDDFFALSSAQCAFVELKHRQLDIKPST